MNIKNTIKCFFGLHELFPPHHVVLNTGKTSCKHCKRKFAVGLKGQHMGKVTPWSNDFEKYVRVTKKYSRSMNQNNLEYYLQC